MPGRSRRRRGSREKVISALVRPAAEQLVQFPPKEKFKLRITLVSPRPIQPATGRVLGRDEGTGSSSRTKEHLFEADVNENRFSDRRAWVERSETHHLHH